MSHTAAPVAPATSVNVDAGDHPIGALATELGAARAASRSSWQEFPYYARRYGERGWRFSLSDSGWITSLCSLSSGAAWAQIEWLGGVLAARGMPRYLLERHLHHLYGELVRNMPSGDARYEPARECGAMLQTLRLRLLPEDRFSALSSGFDQATSSCAERITNMGTVLVGAVIDERAGLAHVVERVADWACDARHFSAAWRAQVERTIAETRSAVT